MKEKQMDLKTQYQRLSDTLDQAYERASAGKGFERHANNRPFEEQDICEELRIFNSVSPALYQVRKKAKESIRLTKEGGINELLDAIVYLSAAVIFLEES